MPLRGVCLLAALAACLRLEAAATYDHIYTVQEELPENVTVGNILKDLKIPDFGAASGTGIIYKLVSNVWGAPPVTVSSATGDIVTTSERIDREELCVGASSAEQHECFFELSGAIIVDDLRLVNIKIVVADINDHAPAFPSPVFRVFPPEDTAINSRFPVPPASDPDAGRNRVQHYWLSRGQGVFGLDVVEGPEGEKKPHLIVLQQLDREQRDAYVMTLKAKDGGTPPRSGTLTVQVFVTDVNDNSPVFEEAQVTARVPENAPVGTSVVQLRATDADAGFSAEIQYLFGPHVTPEAKWLFALNSSTGLITVQGPLDREKAADHRITVLASDRGPAPAEATVTIHVTDVNDNAPTIHLRYIRNPINSIVYLYENEPLHTKIALITVSDKDAGANARVSCSIDREVPFRLKALRRHLYLLETSAALDYEGTSEFSFAVVASDSGKPRLNQTAPVRVRLEDENDNPPVFSRALVEVTVPENNPPGLYLTTVSATDEDSGKNADVVYQLGAHAPCVALDQRTGVLTASGVFDREEQERVVFTVTAWDRGTPPLQGHASIVVTVLDENDNSPTFAQSPFRFAVPENSPRCTPVGVLTVTDADGGVNKAVTLSILGDSEDFALEPVSGQITALVSFDRERRSLYTVEVEAVDGGQPPRSSTAQVTIDVMDVNDNSPVIVCPPSNTSFTLVPLSAAPGSVVADVFAVDTDAGVNADLQYAIAGGNTGGLFSIGPATGNITLEAKPAATDVGLHRLVVRVSDAGEPRPLHTVVLVFLYVNDTVGNAVYIYDLLRRAAGSPLDPDVRDSSQAQEDEDYAIVAIALVGAAVLVLGGVAVAVLVCRRRAAGLRVARKRRHGAECLAASRESAPARREEHSLWSAVTPEESKPEDAAREPLTVVITLPAERGEQGPWGCNRGISAPTASLSSSPDLAKHYRSASLQSTLQLQPGTPTSVGQHWEIRQLPLANTFVGGSHAFSKAVPWVHVTPVPRSAAPTEAAGEGAPAAPDK